MKRSQGEPGADLLPGKRGPARGQHPPHQARPPLETCLPTGIPRPMLLNFSIAGRLWMSVTNRGGEPGAGGTCGGWAWRVGSGSSLTRSSCTADGDSPPNTPHTRRLPPCPGPGPHIPPAAVPPGPRVSGPGPRRPRPRVSPGPRSSPAPAPPVSPLPGRRWPHCGGVPIPSPSRILTDRLVRCPPARMARP